jgi:hypothetical protein
MLEFLFGKPRKSARRKIKRRYNVPGSPCNRLRKNKCRSKRGCAHTKRGCRRAKGILGGSIYEGPMLPSPVSTPEYMKEAAELMFGKKRRAPRRKTSRKGRSSRKPPSAIRKMCKKLKIKITKKVGGRRVYKSLALLKKQIKLKKRKNAKKVTRRKSRFGDVETNVECDGIPQGSNGYVKCVINKYNKMIDSIDLQLPDEMTNFGIDFNNIGKNLKAKSKALYTSVKGKFDRSKLDQYKKIAKENLKQAMQILVTTGKITGTVTLQTLKVLGDAAYVVAITGGNGLGAILSVFN